VSRVELNGRPATAEELGRLAFAGYGHFTSMQLRNHRVRGLDLHLERLARDARQLFDRDLDRDRVLGYLRQATGTDAADLSVQVAVVARDEEAVAAGRPADLDVIVRTGPPVPPSTAPVRVRTVVHERLLPQVKHLATLDLALHSRQARRAGFDDALFLDRQGFVAEGSIWNLALFDGDGVVWPAAPALLGITMQLVQAGLARRGVPSATRPVHLRDLAGFRSAALLNSIVCGQPIVAVDAVRYPEDPDLLALLRAAYEDAPGYPLTEPAVRPRTK
jgi:4-amino-4-deoxychorismate lyase